MTTEAIENELTKLNDIVEQTFYYQQEEYKLRKKIEANKKVISKAMGSRKRINSRIDSELSFEVNKKIKTDIDFNATQLSQKLDKKLYKEATHREYQVVELAPLVKLLKSYGVPPKEFKKHIKTVDEVDKEALDHLLKEEKIGLEDLHGCYEASFEEEIYIKKLR